LASDPNIGLSKGIYADWARGDYSRSDFLDPEVVFVTAFPEHATYHGPQGMGQGWNDFLSAWDDFTTEAEEFIPVPGEEGRYVVLVRLSGLGKESGVPIEGRAANVVTLRNGKIVYFELVWDREEKLRALGLGEG
jgi:ketosteroid isomerase-like protein